MQIYIGLVCTEEYWLLCFSVLSLVTEAGGKCVD